MTEHIFELGSLLLGQLGRAELTLTVGRDLPGAALIQQQIADGVSRKRVGILPDGKAPAREGTEITDADGAPIGTVTSGGFGPSAGGPIAMGYVDAAHAVKDTPVNLVVRGTPRPGRIAPIPFVPNRYYREQE